METKKRFIKNSVANYGQKIIRSSIGIIAIGIIARYLSPDTFGQYAFIIAFMTISEAMAGMGIPMILCREVAKDKEKASILLASGFFLQSMLSIAAMTIIGSIFYLIAPSKGLFYAALICGVAEIFKFLGRFFWSVYQAYERMEFGTLQTLITQCLYLVFLIAAVNYDLGLHGIFIALLMAHLGGSIFGYLLVTRVFIRPSFRNIKGLCKFLFKEAYPLAIKGVFRKLNYRAGTLLLAFLRTDFDVGIFSGPYRIILNLIFIGEASAQAMFPILSRLTATSKSSLNFIYKKSLKFALIIGLPVAIFLSSFSESIIILILGRKYVESAFVLRIVGWTLVPIFLTSYNEKTLVAGNKQYLTTIGMAIALGANTLLNFLLIPKFTYIGSGIAALFSEITVASIGVYFILRYLTLDISLPDVIKPLLAGFITYGILRMFGNINLFLGALLEIGIYVPILFGIKTFTEDEITLLRQLLRRTSPAEPVNI